MCDSETLFIRSAQNQKIGQFLGVRKPKCVVQRHLSSEALKIKKKKNKKFLKAKKKKKNRSENCSAMTKYIK